MIQIPCRFLKISTKMASADNSSSERVDTPPSEGAMATAAIPEDGLTRSVFKNGYYENPWPTWKKINWANVLKFFFWEKNNSDVPKKEVCVCYVNSWLTHLCGNYCFGLVEQEDTSNFLYIYQELPEYIATCSLITQLVVFALGLN